MKLKPVKLAPAVIAVCVILFVCLLSLLKWDFFERLESMTYDWRVRQAIAFSPPAATNIGFVYISDDTIDQISKGLLGQSYGLYWPRHIYGRLLRELSAQDAKAVAFDIIFSGRRPDQGPVPVSLAKWPEAAEFLKKLHPEETAVTYDDGGEQLVVMDSDDYFAWQLQRAQRGILAADHGVRPHQLFATNALVEADISAIRDSDGVLRRAQAFRLYREWHPAFQQVENDPAFGVDLSKATEEPGAIVLHRTELEPIRVPVDADLNFDLKDFVGEEIPAGWSARARAYTEERIWHMGIVLAAQELRLDLASAQVDLANGRITLSGSGGRSHILPVDHNGFFYINWELPYQDTRVTKESVESLLKQDLARSAGSTNGLTQQWAGKLAIVGSQTVGNDLTDRGSTPLDPDTLLASAHWNVANSILTGRFVARISLELELLVIVLMGIIAAFLTWQLRVLFATATIAALAIGYLLLSVFLYVQYRVWIPLVLPIFGAMLMNYVCLMTWRVVFENAEQRRVKSIFSRIVSPNIVNELLQAEKLSLGGARREVSVLFADVRGFTEFTDNSQEKAATYVTEKKLTGPEAEAHFDEQARQILSTVNTYLALVADQIKKNNGTLDKYIGDCVMAFWGSPTPNPQHAVDCVRAAVDAQRAVYEANKQRMAENKSREIENRARASAGLPLKPPLPILLLGTGINTGMATVGLMGSEAHLSNYTVFGREVNLASRLEGLSGRGRIIISEATYRHLAKDDPALAATCIPLPDATTLKGFRGAIKVYEVPWRPPGSTPLEQEFASALIDEKPLVESAAKSSAT